MNLLYKNEIYIYIKTPKKELYPQPQNARKNAECKKCKSAKMVENHSKRGGSGCKTGIFLLKSVKFC